MNVIYFLAGVVVSLVIFIIYDYFVTKETLKIFEELEQQLDEWKSRALEDDQDN